MSAPRGSPRRSPRTRLAPHADVQIPFQRGRGLRRGGAVQEVAASRGGRPTAGCGSPRSGGQQRRFGDQTCGEEPRRLQRRVAQYGEQVGPVALGLDQRPGRGGRPGRPIPAGRSSRRWRPPRRWSRTRPGRRAARSAPKPPAAPGRSTGSGSRCVRQPQDSRRAVRRCGDIGGGSLVERTDTHHRGEPDGGGCPVRAPRSSARVSCRSCRASSTPTAVPAVPP